MRPASIRALTDWMTEAYQIAVLDLTYVSQRFSPKTGKRLKDETTKSDLGVAVDAAVASHNRSVRV